MGYIPTISLNTIKEIIKDSIKSSIDYNSPYIPILILGGSGIGKSQMVKQVAQELSNELNKNFELIDKRMSYYTTSEIMGVPEIIKTENPYIKYIKDGTFPLEGTNHSDYGILFLDEATSVGDKGVLSTMYQILLDKRIDDKPLKKNWFIIAAGNLEEDGGVYYHWPAPARNRVKIFKIDAQLNEWLTYAANININKQVISYLEKNIEKFMTYNSELEEGEDMNNFIFASPRAWEAVSNALDLYEKGYYQNTLKYIICSLIGLEEGESFYKTLKQTNKLVNESGFNIKDFTFTDGIIQPNVELEEEYIKTLISSISKEKNLEISKHLYAYLNLKNLYSHERHLLLSILTIEEVKEVINFMKETNNTMHLTKDLDFLQSIK